MRLLYIIHQFYPESFAGTERFLLHLAHGMQRSGHCAKVVTYGLDKSSEFREEGALMERKYTHERVPVIAIRHPKLSFETNTAAEDSTIYAFAKKHLSEGNYDLVHVVHPMRMISFTTAARELGIPYVVTLTDFWTICPKINLLTSYGMLCTGPESGKACAQLCPELPPAWVRLRLGTVRDTLRGAAAVTVPSLFSASLLKREFPDISAIVVPHGLNLKLQAWREKSYTAGDPITFGYCGGLAPHKGVHLLINAFRTLRADNARLHIHGDAHRNDQAYAAQLRKLANGDQRISFHGRYDPQDVSRILDSIDVAVVPSLWYETYSFGVREAFAARVPVIASSIGVLAETVRDGENGFTFRVGDQSDLASKLQLVVDHPVALQALRQNLEPATVAREEEEVYLYERIYRGLPAKGSEWK
jgi:glycosyltransferase involved in cell wall biosynthesis